MEDWLPFVEKCFEDWLLGEQAGREIFVVPEMGPASSGYNLQHLPDSWSEAVKLRGLLEKAWRKALGSAARRKHQLAAKLQRRGQLASSVRTVSI